MRRTRTFRDWFTPLDEFSKDPNKTSADWNIGDFLPGAVNTFKDKAGRLCAIPWTADVYMVGAARYDIFEKIGKTMPDNFDALPDTLKAIHNQDGVARNGAEIHPVLRVKRRAGSCP